jgi:serine/threonine protein kinase
LGAGASGAVYSAQDDGGQPVAIKLLHPHLDIDPDARLLMQHEVSVLQRLRDPNVAAVIDAELDGVQAFIVTELIEGPTLSAEIHQGGPLDALDLFELADQLGSALQNVHLSGVVHRDVKPANVIVAERGPVLIDFGVASDLSEPPPPGYVVGTPGFLAPELLEGSAPTPSTDWWSWAAVLAFAATGRPPFGSGARDDVLLRTRQGRADLVGLPPRTADALMGALAPEPAVRTSPAEVMQAIRRDRDEARRSLEISGPVQTVAVMEAVPPTVAYPVERMQPTRAFPSEFVTPTIAYPAEVVPPTLAYPADVTPPTLSYPDEFVDPTIAYPVVEPTMIAPVATTHLGSSFLDSRLSADPTLPVLAATQQYPGLPWNPTQRLAWAHIPTLSGLANPNLLEGASQLPQGAQSDRNQTRAFADQAPHQSEPQPGQPLPEQLQPGQLQPEQLQPGQLQPTDPAPLPYPAAPTWYRRPVPPPRTPILLGLGALLVSIATGWPVLALAAFAVLVIVARIIGTAWEDLVNRRELAGRRRANDLAVVAAKTPWTVLRAILGALPQLLVGAGVAVLVAAACWWVIGHFDLPAGPLASHPYLIGVALAVMSAMLSTWFAVNSARTRLGARLALTAFSGRSPLTYIFLVALLIGATVLAVSHFSHPIEINWWPLPTPPIL